MRRDLLSLTGRKALFVLVPAACVAGLDAVSQALGGGVGGGRTAIVALAVVLLLWLATSWLDAHPSRSRAEVREGADDGGGSAGPRRGSWRSACILAGLAFVLWLVMFSLYGPFASMNDTVHIINNPFAVARQHPIMYGLVTAGAVRGIAAIAGWGAASALTALAQMVLFAAALAWALRTLETLGVPRTLRVLLAFALGLFPLTADYSFALVKDAPFAAFVLALTAALLTVHASRGAAVRSRGFALAFLLTLVCFAVTRNNALPVLALVVVLAIMLAPAARGRTAVLGALALLLALVPQQLVTMAVGPQKFVETVGVPLQMEGYTLVHAPGCIPAADAAYLDRIFPADRWREDFHPQSVDPTKDDPAFDRDELQATKKEFVTHFLSVLRACPGPMIHGYLVHTQPLWQLDGPAVSTPSQSVFLEPISNYPADREELIAELADRGVSTWQWVPAAVREPLRAAEEGVLARTPGSGIWVMALLLLGVLFAYARRGEGLAIVVPSILLWGTLMAAAPVALPFRYVAFLPWVVLVGLVVLLGARGGRERRRR